MHPRYPSDSNINKWKYNNNLQLIICYKNSRRRHFQIILPVYRFKHKISRVFFFLWGWKRKWWWWWCVCVCVFVCVWRWWVGGGGGGGGRVRGNSINLSSGWNLRMSIWQYRRRHRRSHGNATCPVHKKGLQHLTTRWIPIFYLNTSYLTVSFIFLALHNISSILSLTWYLFS